jgi:RimJ/RimL family protein N-acetyltransferase
MRTPFPFTRDAARGFVAHAQSLLDTRGGYILAMVERRTGAVIGVASLTLPTGELPPGQTPVEGILGYAIRYDRWGQRFASEAVAAIVQFAFQTLGLTRLRATVMQGNVASRRVLERLGFTLSQSGVAEQPLYGEVIRLMDRYILDKTHPE